MRALLLPGDGVTPGAGGYRAEFKSSDRASEGAERWYAISYYFPGDWNQGRNGGFNDRIIYQFADGGPPMWSLHIREGGELFIRQSPVSGEFRYHASWRMPIERWTDITFHVRWTQDDDGFFRVTADGRRVLDYRGRTLSERSSTYSKWGIYGQPSKVIFDRVMRGEDGPPHDGGEVSRTPTPTASPRATVAPRPTDTPRPTATQRPVASATATPRPTAPEAPPPAATAGPAPASVPEVTSTPRATPVPTREPTPVPREPTPVPREPTPVLTREPTPAPTQESTPTPTPEPTQEPTPRATRLPQEPAVTATPAPMASPTPAPGCEVRVPLLGVRLELCNLLE